ncbi:ABC-2 family transporter permease [Marinitenerispora sediminis]|uniref:Lantibiotic ABC transporter permease n=1 Tax=Marinitenerispora sediminis TaxID=1931232 RepID=A0A368T9K8_9ACTN|nr:hypothetical protein [Marinitenerispora sediminis]RCV52800.1 hypothetical protein DEF28_12080 [Marinitenerispora sediminis]RCV59905.1 hypothetical protein DEF23_06060 [Marinitenerispora sediminis]RCV61321.1 hypothetical protein DEF24_04595 [Marinitenerispora sediminis]
MTGTRAVRSPRAAARDDPPPTVVVRTELARLRYGFPLWYTLAAPVVLVLPLGAVAAGSPEGQAGLLWETWRSVVLMFWGVLAPMGSALYAGLAVRQDQDARRLLYGYAFPRHRLLLGRFAALALLGMAQALLLGALLAGLGVLLGAPGGAAAAVAAGVVLTWLAGLGALALCLLVAEMWGFTATMCVGIAGMMFGALLADKSVWWAIPLAWPMRVVVPIADIHASGVPLPPGDPLSDAGVVPVALAMSFVLAAVLLGTASRHVNRKEL